MFSLGEIKQIVECFNSCLSINQLVYEKGGFKLHLKRSTIYLYTVIAEGAGVFHLDKAINIGSQVEPNKILGHLRTPDLTVNISSPVKGIIKQIYKNSDDPVGFGERLFLIECP